MPRVEAFILGVGVILACRLHTHQVFCMHMCVFVHARNEQSSCALFLAMVLISGLIQKHLNLLL